MPEVEYRGIIYKLPRAIMCGTGREFALSQQLGAGGNGVVFECEETTTGDLFAVKIQLVTKGVRGARFERELEVMKRLSHAHIVSYEDDATLEVEFRRPRWRSPSTRQLRAVVMRRADCSLADLMETKRGELHFDEYFGQLTGLAAALVELHKYAVHRDIKPGNILVSGEIWQISDFGLCGLLEPDPDEALTREDEHVGPRYWMSPGAVAKAMNLGDAIEPRSDVFQLASVFWFIATRRPPIGILTQEDWTGGPDALCELLLEALQHSPSRRPQSAQEFLDGLQALRDW